MAAISLTTHIAQHDRPRKMVAAHFREVAAGDDAELGRQRLEQHRDQIGEQHDPEQSVAVSGAGLDVGGEIPGVHIGDRGDDRRAGEHRIGAPAAALSGQHLLGGGDGALGQRAPGARRVKSAISSRT